jgi:hypothetical protein
MADLTMLHAPSTLHLPDVNETGFHFTFNRRSLPPPPLITTTPMVTVEMVDDGDSPPASPVTAKDKTLLSPPRRSFRSKKPPKLSPPRPHSAPPGPASGDTRIFDPPNRFSPRPRTPDDPFSDIPSTAPIVRPPTILCAYIVPFGFKHLRDIFLTLSPPKTVLEEYSTFSCDWDVLRLVPSSDPSLDVHSCWTSFRQARRGSVCFRCRVARRDRCAAT